MSNVVELNVKRPALIRLSDGREFSLTFPLAAVIELETKLGRNMRNALDWLKITPSELPAIIAAGLTSKYENASEVADEIVDHLDAESVEQVIEGMCWAAFPRAMEGFALQIEKMRAATAAGTEYAPGNVSGAVAS